MTWGYDSLLPRSVLTQLLRWGLIVPWAVYIAGRTQSLAVAFRGQEQGKLEMESS